MDGAVVPRLRIVHGLLRHQLFAHQLARAIQRHLGVFQVGFGGVQIGQRLRDLLRPRAVHGLGQLGLQAGELPLGLLQLRLVLVVLQAHQHLPFPHPVALFHADPVDLADHLGGHFDLVRRHNVARGVEHHSFGRGGRADGLHPLDFDQGSRIQPRRKEAPRAQPEEQQDARDDNPDGPWRRPIRAPLAAVDLQILQFRVHKIHNLQTSRKAVRISFLEAMRAGNSPPRLPSTTAKAMPTSMISGVR